MAELLYGPNQVAEFPQAGPGYANDAVAKNIPGRVIQYAGKKYRYVQFDNGTANVAALASGVVYWKTLDPSTGTFIVTSDETDTLAGINGVAGVLEVAGVTDQYYTWIVVGGVVDALVAASTVAGDKMIGSATDQTFNRLAAAAAVTDKVFGIALDAIDTAGTSKVLLQNLDW
jgi:hypothetical protein